MAKKLNAGAPLRALNAVKPKAIVIARLVDGAFAIAAHECFVVSFRALMMTSTIERNSRSISSS